MPAAPAPTACGERPGSGARPQVGAAIPARRSTVQVFSAYGDDTPYLETGRSRQIRGRDLRLTLLERHETLGIVRTRIVGARPDQPVVRVLLEDVRGPPRHAADSENRRVEIDRDAQGVVHRRRVEVDVRIQLLFRLD